MLVERVSPTRSEQLPAVAALSTNLEFRQYAEVPQMQLSFAHYIMIYRINALFLLGFYSWQVYAARAASSVRSGQYISLVHDVFRNRSCP